MSHPDTATPPTSGPPAVDARGDLRAGLGWMVFGFAILIASIRMDRLEQQHINPNTVPGLLPGLLGILMTLLGSLLAWRSWQRKALASGAGHVPDNGSAARIALVLVLCVSYAVLLVGHGLPFWIATSIFVTLSVLSLQHPQRVASGQRLNLRGVLLAALIGTGCGLIVSLVFQQLFLIRLP